MAFKPIGINQNTGQQRAINENDTLQVTEIISATGTILQMLADSGSGGGLTLTPPAGSFHGDVLLSGGSAGGSGGTVRITGGAADQGGNVFVTGGQNSTFNGTGNLTLAGGPGTGPADAGNLILQGGTSISGSPSPILMQTGNSSQTWVKLDPNGNVILNASGSNLAQAATNGFTYLPVCDTGAPSGTPSVLPTGAVPTVWQGTTLYVYSGGVWNAVGSSSITINSYTADTTLSGTPTIQYSNNTGASGAVQLTLPTAVSGMAFIFYVTTAQFLKVQTATGAQIYLGVSPTAVTGFVRSNAIGSALRLVAQSSTLWIAESVAGTWTIDT